MADEVKPAIAPPTPAPDGWAGVYGFLDGVGGATQRVGGIVETVADGAEDVARGKAAIANQRLEKQQGQLDLALKLRGFERGDNKLTLLAVAAAAVAVIVMMK